MSKKRYLITLAYPKEEKFKDLPKFYFYYYSRIDTAIDSFWYFIADNINAPRQFSSINIFDLKTNEDITTKIILDTSLMKKYFRGIAS